MATGDDLVEDNDEEVGMTATEDRDVEGESCCVGLVQANSKVPLTTEQKKNENPNVHKSNPGLVCSGVVQIVQYGNKQL